jgi:tRNA threonylcarbamoyl adenosine modification protein (Sua5/YciO/YrdC/YwlC family)
MLWRRYYFQLAADSLEWIFGFSLDISAFTQGTDLSAEIVKINSDNPEPALVSYVAKRLQAGHVMGLPTDTFYGLAADPYNLRAVELIYEVKSRSKHKPLSLLVESVDQAEELADVNSSDYFDVLARKYWPGPLTIIMRAAARLPLKVTANTGNVAIRVPAAAIPLAVIRAAGVPVTATSANVSGASECTTAEGVREQLGNLIPLIVDGGPSPREVPSTIVDLTGDHWRVLREGTIPTQELTQLLGE